MSFAQLNDYPVQTTRRLRAFFFNTWAKNWASSWSGTRTCPPGFGHMYECAPAKKAKSELGTCYFEVFTILQEMFTTDAYSSTFHKL